MTDFPDTNKLTGDYKIAYFDILSYMQGSNISVTGEFSIEVQEDMMDMLLSAQKNQLPVSNIIGKDIKKFCEDIVQSHNTVKKIKLLGILKKSNFSLGYLGLSALLFQIVNEPLRLNYIIIVFYSFLLLPYMFSFFYKKLCLKFKGLKNKIKCILLLLLASMLVLFPLLLLISKYCNLIFNGYYTAIICLLLILAIHTLCKKLDKNFMWYSYLR